MLCKLNRRGGRLLLEIMAAATVAAMSSTPAHAASCFISPESVNFGVYDPFDPVPLDGVGNIAVSCDAPTAFTIALGPGSGSYDQRLMQGGQATMSYNIYTDPARLFVWGDDSGSGSTLSDVTTSGHYPVYGRIPPHQNLPAATYSDTIVVTVTY